MNKKHSNQGENNYNYKHGLSKHRLMVIWSSMMTRCYNPKSIGYKKYYGSKGIKVCDRWHKFINFYNDMIPIYKDGLTLDRYPNSKGNYEPENVRWVTTTQQARNISCNIMVEYEGQKMCIGELAEKVNLPYTFVYHRIVDLEWSVDKTLTTPNRYQNYINFNGEKHTIKDWAEKLGMNQQTLAYRIKAWGSEVAFKANKGRPNKYHKNTSDA